MNRSKFNFVLSFLTILVASTQAFSQSVRSNKLAIESVMRAFQARHVFVSGTYIAWPVCPCDNDDPDDPPAFPPDGFYGACDDSSETRYLIEYIYDHLGELGNEWVDPEWNPEGYSIDDPIPYVVAPTIDFGLTSVSNAQALELIQEYISKLKKIRLVEALSGTSGHFTDYLTYYGSGSSPDAQPPYNESEPPQPPLTCDERTEIAGARMLDAMNVVTISAYNISVDHTKRTIKSCSVSGNWNISYTSTLNDAKIEIVPNNVADYRGSGVIYMAGDENDFPVLSGTIRMPAELSSPTPPVMTDKCWHEYDAFALSSTIEWKSSNYVLNVDEVPPQFDCIDPCPNGDVYQTFHWHIHTMLCIYTPEFETNKGSGSCKDHVIVPDPKKQDKPGETDEVGHPEPTTGWIQIGKEDCDEGDDLDGDGGERIAPCDEGEQASGGGDPQPITADPVMVATGYKFQEETDLTVTVPGMRFALTREYTSDGLSSTDDDFGLVGAGWTMSAFGFLKEESVSGHVELIRTGSARRSVRFKPQGSGPVKWYASGGVTGWIEESSLTIDGVAHPTWRLIEPGVSETHFYRSGTGVSAALVGLILQWKDMHGNTRTYSYVEYGSSSPKSARLRQIDLNGREAVGGVQPSPPADATVVFHWNVSDNDPLPASHGRLSQVDVLRYLGAGAAPRVTQSVGYRYFETGAGFDAAVGTDGDLIEVTYYDLIDEAAGDTGPAYWTRVKQYRYHSGTGASGWAEDQPAEDRTELNGRDHQLKCVIEPEQVEYFAQKRHASDMTVDDDAVLESADFLLTQADDDTWTDGGNTREVLDLAAKVISYYDTMDGNRVSTQFLQTNCGCGGSPQGLRHVFTYITYTSGSDEWRSTIIDEHIQLSNGSYDSDVYRRKYADAQRRGDYDTFYLVYTVTEDPTSGSLKRWITSYSYDSSNRVTRVSTPAAVTAATDYTPITTSSAPSVTLNSTGLCYGYVYNSDNRLIETRIGTSNQTIASQYTLLSKTYYPSSSGTYTRTFLPERVDRFVGEVTSAGSASADQIQTTWYRYGFRSDDDIGWMRTSVEAETSGENGPASTGSVDPENGTANVYDYYSLYDTLGREVWSRGADKSLTYREYEPVTGYMTAIVTNADPAGSPASGNPELDSGDYPSGVTMTGWGHYAEGGSLKTTYAHDFYGRIIERTSPGGVKSYSRQEMRECEERPGIKYLANIRLPHKVDTPSDEFNGPMSINLVNAGGKTIQSSEYALNGATDYDPVEGEYTVLTTVGTSGELSRSTTQHTVSGLMSSSKRYADLGGGYPTTGSQVVYATSYEYDALGRVSKVTDVGGTVTENSKYDVLDRVLEVKVGTVSTSMETVAQYFYDSATMAQGVGNGNQTFVRLYTGDIGGLATTNRDTQYVYDGRDRLVKTIPPLNAGGPQAPYTVLKYDNLDRVIKRGLFTGSPTGSDYGIGDTSKRAFYVETDYGQRGLAVRKRVAIDPADSTPDWLAADTWYDSVGRSVSQSFPSSPRIKRVFDGHGRSIEEYLSDARNDAAPGASGSYEDAIDVEDDVVLEQTVREYNDDGLLVSENMYSLVHDEQDETTLGSLVSAASDVKIVTTTGYVYDDADRIAATIDYGTNDADDKFISGTTLPTVPTTVAGLSSLPSWAIVNQVEYDPNRGVANFTIDPLGRVTKTLYDDLYRPIATIENYDDTNPVTLGWNSTHGRWSVTAGLSTSDPDVNRVTSVVYDGLDHVTRRVAHLPGTSGEKVQVTAYEYGVTSSNPAYAGSSLLNSNNLLRIIRYPDDTTGEVSTTADHLAWFTYNRLGEMRFAGDQNGGGHVYYRDTAGRVTRDWVVTVPSLTGAMAIDGTIRHIDTAYDTMGRITSVRSRDASNVERNTVRFTYTKLWQIDKLYQDADGVGSLAEVNVDYDYQTLTGGGAYGNTSRMQQMTYPSGSALEYLYSDNVSDRISRVTNLELDGTDIVQYSYLGRGTPVVTDYIQPDLQLDYTLDADGKRRAAGYTETAQGFYPGLDRFGRVKRHTWADGDLHYDGTTGPTMAPHISRLYSYDVNSNVLTDYDGGTEGDRPDTDFAYEYDELDRLIEARRGAWSGSAFVESSVSGDKRSESWQLDMLGNWLQYRRNLDGMTSSGEPEYNNDGSSPLETQSRTFNAFNEITALDPDAAGGASSLGGASFIYDHNGTLREMPAITTGPTESEDTTGKRFYYDCWNRLIRVEEDSGSGFAAVGEYEYNGLHWRTKKTCRVGPSATSMTQTRLLYYDASWRLIEEHIENPPPTANCTEPEQRVAQQVWGAGGRGLDDSILRRIEKSACVDMDTNLEDEIYDWQYTFGVPSTYAGWDATYYYLTDVTFSPRALTTGAGVLFERVDYDAYGRGRRWNENVNLADFNGVNGVTVQDIYDFLSAWLAGDPSADINGVNGVTVQDIFDFLTLWLAGGGPAIEDGLISASADINDGSGNYIPAPDSPIGYRGYVFNPEVSGGGLYTVRFRNYLPLLGRWNERDPAGFVDGNNIYEYALGNSITWTDPLGLDTYEWQDVPGYKDGRHGIYHHQYRIVRGWWSWLYGPYELIHVQTTFTPDDEEIDDAGMTDYSRSTLNAIGTIASKAKQTVYDACQAGMFVGAIALPGPDDAFFAGLAFLRGAKAIQKIGGKWFKILEDGTEVELKADEACKVEKALSAECKIAKAAKEAAQLRKLSNGDIKLLKKKGIDPHDLKPNSKYDLFKDKDGNLYVKPKDGSGPGDPTGINLYD